MIKKHFLLISILIILTIICILFLFKFNDKKIIKPDTITNYVSGYTSTIDLYDENLKIVSDWKWYTEAIGLGRVKPVYVNIDVTIFDAEGISETNLKLRNEERAKVLKEITPPAVWEDFYKHSFHIDQMNRLERHPLFYKLVWFIERCLFKWERWTKK